MSYLNVKASLQATNAENDDGPLNAGRFATGQTNPFNPFTPTSAYKKTALISQGFQVSCSIFRGESEVHHKTCK